jgi:hypothetical protein
MISWFEKNIGPFSKEPDLDNSIYTGNGWKWFKHVIYDTGSQGQTVTYTSYFVEIDDEVDRGFSDNASDYEEDKNNGNFFSDDEEYAPSVGGSCNDEDAEEDPLLLSDDD